MPILDLVGMRRYSEPLQECDHHLICCTVQNMGTILREMWEDEVDRESAFHDCVDC